MISIQSHSPINLYIISDQVLLSVIKNSKESVKEITARDLDPTVLRYCLELFIYRYMDICKMLELNTAVVVANDCEV